MVKRKNKKMSKEAKKEILAAFFFAVLMVEIPILFWVIQVFTD